MILRLVAALASGAILCVVSPPIGQHWLEWFSFIGLFWALRPGEHRRNAWLGYATGWIAVFLLFGWLIETIVVFSNLPWVAALVIHMIFATAFALPYALVFGSVHWLCERFGLLWVFLTPAVQVAVEQLSPALFPYYMGVGQYQTLPIWQGASVFGVTGISYLLILVNCVLAEALYRHKEGRPQPWGALAGVGALWLCNLGFGFYRLDALRSEAASAPVLKVSQLQQNVTMEERLAASIIEGLQDWMVLTRKIARQGADLVVWPEGSIFFNPNDEKEARALGERSPRQFFEDLAKAGKFDFLIGGGTIQPDPAAPRGVSAFNSVYLFTREGELTERYDKMVPLPFGEYIPLSDTFPILREWIEGPGDFQAGKRPTVFTGHTADGSAFTYTVPICYEAILEGQMWTMYRGEKADPVDLFVNITNDGWFGDTAAPHQHGMLAAVQAIHFGRPVVRSAYTGVSFNVTPWGELEHVTAPFTEEARVVELRLSRVDTVYTAGGWLFPYLCVGLSAAAFVRGRRRGPLPSQA